MFKVENADFIADRLAAELAPLQEFREVAKNALEAIMRRRHGSSDQTGRVEFDVDWCFLPDGWYISCADDGDGMNRAEIEKYSTTLAVVGANKNQSMTGNQGMGLKISGPTRHPHGVLIRSLKDGEASMVRLGFNRDSGQYDLIEIDAGKKIVSVRPELFPSFIQRRGTGTVVTFCGTGRASNTFVPTNQPKYWLLKYLNGRFANLCDDEIEVSVRVPVGREEEWPRSREEADRRQSGLEGKHFLFNRVLGTMKLWETASDSLGPGHRGVVELVGDAVRGIPPARMHWFVLPSKSDPGIDVSSRTFSGGSFSTMYQGELYDWRNNRAADPLFARCGILFGKSRIGLILQPYGETVHDDFARKSVLVGDQEALRSDAWHEVWSIQFRNQLPNAIRDLIAREQQRLEEEDPSRKRRIQDRLREIFEILRSPRYRKSPTGESKASDTSVKDLDVGEGDTPGITEHDQSGDSRSSKSPRNLGDLLLAAIDEGTTRATPVNNLPEISVRWISEPNANDLSLVQSDGHGVKDRAAALIGEDGRLATEIAANCDFRMYQSILGSFLTEFNPEGDDDKALLITKCAREWFEQKLIETVVGIRMLENDGTWSPAALTEALDPKSLTAAFISDTFHTRSAIRREIARVLVASG